MQIRKPPRRHAKLVRRARSQPMRKRRVSRARPDDTTTILKRTRPARCVAAAFTLTLMRRLASSAALGGPMQTAPRARRASNAQPDNLRRREARLARLALLVNTTTTRAMQTAHLRFVRAVQLVRTHQRARHLARTVRLGGPMRTAPQARRAFNAQQDNLRRREAHLASTALRESTMTIPTPRPRVTPALLGTTRRRA